MSKKVMKDSMKVLLAGVDQDGKPTGNTMEVDMTDLAGLRTKAKAIPDHALMAMVEALNETHDVVHAAMNVLMEEGSKRFARKLMADLKKDPDKLKAALEQVESLIAAIGDEGDGVKKEVTPEDLEKMDVQGHA